MFLWGHGYYTFSFLWGMQHIIFKRKKEVCLFLSRQKMDGFQHIWGSNKSWRAQSLVKQRPCPSTCEDGWNRTYLKESRFWGSLTHSNQWFGKTVPVGKNAFLTSLITRVPSPGPTEIGESWFLGVAPDLHTSECVIIVIISKIIILKEVVTAVKIQMRELGALS